MDELFRRVILATLREERNPTMRRWLRKFLDAEPKPKRSKSPARGKSPARKSPH